MFWQNVNTRDDNAENNKMNLRIIFLLVIFLLPTAYGLEIVVQVKDFGVGEVMSFNYSISSDVPEIVDYLPYIQCVDAPEALSEVLESRVNSSSPLRGVFYGPVVGEDWNPQICNASVILIGSEDHVSKEFKIKTLPSLDYELRICLDAGCVEQGSIYSLGEVVYIDYVSNESDYDQTAELILPGGKWITVNPPLAYLPDVPGTYIVKMTALKPGYRNTTKEASFEVIKKHAQTRSAVICRVDGLCSGRENHTNCPQDCDYSLGESNESFAVPENNLTAVSAGESDSGTVLQYILFFGLGVIFLAVLALFYLKRRGDPIQKDLDMLNKLEGEQERLKNAGKPPV